MKKAISVTGIHRTQSGRRMTDLRALHRAVREGGIEELRKCLMNLGANAKIAVNQCDDEDQIAPLHLSVRSGLTIARDVIDVSAGSRDVIEFFTWNEAAFEGIEIDDVTSKRGNVLVTELLLQHGADVSLMDEDGKQAIHYAAKYQKSAKTVPRKSTTNNEDSKSSSDKPKNILQVLLEHDADVKARDKFLATPLHYACDRGHVEAVNLLTSSRKADLEVRDDHMSTPLHEAARHGHDEIVKILLDSCGKDAAKLIEAKDENGCTTLSLACRDGHRKTVEVLLNATRKAGSSAASSLLLDQDLESATALHAAVESGSAETTSYLLATWEIEAQALSSRFDQLFSGYCKYVDMKRSDGNTALHLAADGGSVDILRVLLSSQAQVNGRNARNQTPLHNAAQRNHLECVKLLLKNGADPELTSNRRLTPLLVACQEGHVDIVRHLTSINVNMAATDARERSCLALAASAGREDVIKEILSRPVGNEMLQETDRDGDTPLHVAASGGIVAIVKLLADRGSILDARNDREQTPLHLAALRGRLQVVQELIGRERLLLNDQDDHSRTALHLAASSGHLEIVNELILLGANTTDVDSKARTPLDVCIIEGWIDCARVLLEADPKLVNNKTRELESTLHLACKSGKLEMVTLLLSWKASPSVRLPDGRNALDVAIDNNHEDCALKLIEHKTWKESLRNATEVENSGLITTPLRKLIERMPEVAELVMTKCMTFNDERSESRLYEVNFNYEFLDDAYEIPRWTASTGNKEQFELHQISMDYDSDKVINISSSTEDIYEASGKLKKNAQPYNERGESVAGNHPLKAMVRNDQERLLRHPTVTSLLNHKWWKYGRYIYFVNLLSYLVFMAALNVYMTTNPPRFAVNQTATEQQVQNRNQCVVLKTDAQVVWGSECIGLSTTRYISIVLVIAFSSIQLIKEVFQMIHQRLKYFLDVTNYMELTLYTLSILVFVDTDPLAASTGIRERWQWECGAFTVLLSWLNLLLYVRRSKWLGIYIFMFASVAFTFIRFTAVLILFLLGFSFSFYVLLQNQYSFYTPITSIVKTFVMMIGEMDYAKVFLSHFSSSDYTAVVHYDTTSYVVFVIFVVVMSLLLTNLLVGLAVDDITSVQQHASLKRIALQVDGMLTMEYGVPSTIRRRWMVRKRCVRPNKNAGRHPLFRWVFDEEGMKPRKLLEAISPESLFMYEFIADSDQNEIHELKTENAKIRREIHDLKENINAIAASLKQFTEDQQRNLKEIERIKTNETKIKKSPPS